MGQQGEETPISDGAALDAPRASDELYQAFVNEPTPVGIDPSDGLPRHQVPHSIRLALAPALDPATFVCAGEHGDFVLRNSWGDTLATFATTEAVRAPGGFWRVPTRLAYERMKDNLVIARARQLAEKHDPTAHMMFASEDPFLFMRAVFGNSMTAVLISIEWIQVEPARAQCAHYARQLTDFTDDPDFKMITRLCTARRTDEGEFLSLRDGRMYACELREPRHALSEQLLDDFDTTAIAMGRATAAKETETFDVDAALKKMMGADGADPDLLKMAVDVDAELRSMASAAAAELGLNLVDAEDGVERMQSLGVLGVAMGGKIDVDDD